MPVHYAPMSHSQQQKREHLADAFFGSIPHNQALGTSIVQVGEGLAVARLEYRQDLLGDIQEGIWHTGPAISLADATCGLSVTLALPEVEAVATLDLRMDYLQPAVGGEPLIARAECYHVTRRVAFARASLHQGDLDEPTAICTAAFIRTGNATPVSGEVSA